MKDEYSYLYIDNQSLLVINPKGQLRRLYVPFRVRCINATDNIPEGSWVIVEEVWQDEKERLLFSVQGRLIAFCHFQIKIQF